MPFGIPEDWKIWYNGQPVGVTGTVSIEDCDKWTTTTACGDFIGEITVELTAFPSPNLYDWYKTLFRRIPASMLSNHIWSKRCQNLRRVLRARWRL